MKRTEAAALAGRLVAWLERTRRAEVDEFAAGVVARTARLGANLVIHESGPRAHGLLVVADARTGDLVFVSEWHPPSGEDATLMATPEALAAITADLDGVTAAAMVVH